LQQNPNELSPTIAFGADLYHGLGGSDFVTLPDKANTTKMSETEREVLAALPFGNGLVTIDVGGIVLS